jgi:hypothetical protein
LRVFDQAVVNNGVYEGEGVKGAMLRNIPFCQSYLKPSLNGLGEPLHRSISDRFYTVYGPDRVWGAMVKYDAPALPIAMEWKGKPLEKDQLYDVVRISGPKIREALQEKGMLDDLAKMPKANANRIMEHIIRREHDNAKRQVMLKAQETKK